MTGSWEEQITDIRQQLDPWQIHNYFGDASPPKSYNIAGRPFDEIIPRLNALMMVLKSCKGVQCREPWTVLHPGRNVTNLVDALSHEYDTFYREQPMVIYSSCEVGYLKWAEGPQHVNVFGPRTHEQLHDQNSQKYDGAWHEWI